MDIQLAMVVCVCVCAGAIWMMMEVFFFLDDDDVVTNSKNERKKQDSLIFGKKIHHHHLGHQLCKQAWWRIRIFIKWRIFFLFFCKFRISRATSNIIIMMMITTFNSLNRKHTWWNDSSFEWKKKFQRKSSLKYTKLKT